MTTADSRHRNYEKVVLSTVRTSRPTKNREKYLKIDVIIYERKTNQIGIRLFITGAYHIDDFLYSVLSLPQVLFFFLRRQAKQYLYRKEYGARVT